MQICIFSYIVVVNSFIFNSSDYVYITIIILAVNMFIVHSLQVCGQLPAQLVKHLHHAFLFHLLKRVTALLYYLEEAQVLTIVMTSTL